MQDWLWSLRELFTPGTDIFTRLNLLMTSVVFWVGLSFGMQAGDMVFIHIVIARLLGTLPSIDPLYYLSGAIVLCYLLTHVLLRFVKVMPPPSATRMGRFLFLIPATFSSGFLILCIIFAANQITGIDERTAHYIVLLIWLAVSVIPIRKYL